MAMTDDGVFLKFLQDDKRPSPPHATILSAVAVLGMEDLQASLMPGGQDSSSLDKNAVLICTVRPWVDPLHLVRDCRV